MFSKLVNDFQQVALSKEGQEPNFFEICGFPHFELVASNVLSFFFNPIESHGFNDLFIRSFLEAAKIEFARFDLDVNVERETKTNKGGFIDILLHNETFSIAIENKIFAGLYNDLDDYLIHAKEKSKTAFVVVLSMYEEVVTGEAKKNVTYSTFFNYLRKNMGNYIGLVNLKYVTLMTDFMRNIEDLSKGEINMNEEFLDFIRNNSESVQRIGAEIKSFHDSLRRLVYDVNSAIVEMVNDPGLKQWPWRNLPELFDVAVSDFLISDGQAIAIDSIINVHHWSFEVFVRKENGRPLDIKAFFEAKGLIGVLDQSRGRFILNEHLPFKATPFEVAKKISEIITKIKA